MLRHPQTRWTIAFAMSMALLVNRVVACSCREWTICELVQEAQVVFLGEVIAGGLNPGEDPWSGRPQFATLRIIEAYKGLPASTREIKISLSYLPGMCS